MFFCDRPSLTVRPDPGLRSQPLRWELSATDRWYLSCSIQMVPSVLNLQSCSPILFCGLQPQGVVLDSRGRVREGPLMDTKMAATLIFTSRDFRDWLLHMQLEKQLEAVRHQSASNIVDFKAQVKTVPKMPRRGTNGTKLSCCCRESLVKHVT